MHNACYDAFRRSNSKCPACSDDWGRVGNERVLPVGEAAATKDDWPRRTRRSTTTTESADEKSDDEEEAVADDDVPAPAPPPADSNSNRAESSQAPPVRRNQQRATRTRYVPHRNPSAAKPNNARLTIIFPSTPHSGMDVDVEEKPSRPGRRGKGRRG